MLDSYTYTYFPQQWLSVHQCRAPQPLGPQTSMGPLPVRNRAAQQEVSGGQASGVSSAAPHRSHCRLSHSLPAPPPEEKLCSLKPVPGAKKVGDRCTDGAVFTNSVFWCLFDCFPLLLHFLTSLIEVILWLKFFYRQKAGKGHGREGP